MSVYSTPLVSASDNDSVSTEDSKYFTPEVSFSAMSPRESFRSNSINGCESKLTASDSPVFGNHVQASLNNRESVNEKDWNPTYNKENDYCSTPTRNSVELTPRRRKSTPLKCITNVVTPIQRKSMSLKCDDHAYEYEKEKENILKQNSNKNAELSSSILKNNLNPMLKSRLKNINKHKSTFLQRLGIRHKSKVEYNSLTNEDANSVASALSPAFVNDIVFTSPNIERLDVQKTKSYDIVTSEKCEQSSKYFLNNLKVINESYHSIPLQEDTSKHGKIFWRNFYYYPSVLTAKSIRLSPVKRFFSYYRKKLLSKPIRNLFTRKEIDNKPTNVLLSSSEKETPCQCSMTALSNHELLTKILLKLNSLENQISDIKTCMRNNGVDQKASISCLPPPPALPPPPPPPLPDLLFSPAGALKQLITTPDISNQVKKKLPAKTQFAITVDDIRSVKLRKTPCTAKKSAVGTTNTPILKDGVVHSVKFKPIKRSAVQKKELSNLVSEILSPSKNTDRADRNIVLSPKLFDDKENHAISRNFEITPVKSLSKNIRVRSTKRKDLTLDSPKKKGWSAVHKTLVFNDNGTATHH